MVIFNYYDMLCQKNGIILYYMADNLLSFELSEKVIDELIKIKEELAKLSSIISSLTEAEKAYMNHCAMISNVGASTRIENAILTDYEIEWIDSALSEDDKTTAFEQSKEAILNKLSKDKERSIEEVVGCREMLIFVYDSVTDLFPLREVMIRELHKELLRHYPKAGNYLGRYKQVTNRVISRNQITGEEKTILEPAAPGPITEAAMSDLTAWYNRAMQECKWSLMVSIEFVFRFLAIHPFQDGNGRTGRALFILSLLQSSDPLISAAAPFMAIDRHIEKKRPLYYSALRKCSNGYFLADSRQYQYEPIILFLLKVFRESIKDIELYRNKFKKIQELTNNELKIYECLKSFPEKKLSSTNIHEASGLSLRTVQRDLIKLCDKGFLHKRGQKRGTVYQLVF